MKRKYDWGQNSASGRSKALMEAPRISNGRACIHCHQLKKRCDILDKGAPCTNCRSRHRSDCRIFPKKQWRGIEAQPGDPVQICPRTVDSSTEPGQITSPSSADVAASAPTDDGEEHDSRHLANFFDRHDMREANVDRLTRVCFIGTGMSNCHYLVRQNPSGSDDEGILHLGYSQEYLRGNTYARGLVPSEILERPEKEVADALIQAYFNFVNCGWPIVDEDDFMAQYEGENPENTVSLALLNAVFLVGAHVLAPHDSRMRSLQPVFFRRAKTLIDSRLEMDRVVYVQVALLMTWHSDGLEEVIGSAWHWVGIAVRTAMAFGLYRDATRSRMLPVYKRVCTRLWWILFQFDTIASVSSGRPQIINLVDSDVPDLEYSHFEGVYKVQRDFVIHQTKLCIIISQTMREAWGLRSSPQDRVRATKRGDELLADFILQLPTQLQLKFSSLDSWQSILHLTYNNFIILLHRPPPKQGPAEIDLVIDQCCDSTVCGEAAGTIASIFEALVSQGALSTLWLYSSNVLVTATIHVIHEAGSSKPIVAAKSHFLLESLMTALRGLSKHWRYARAWLHFFEQRALKLKQQRAAKTQADISKTGQHPEEHGHSHSEASMSLSSVEAQSTPQGAEELSYWRDNATRARDNMEMSFLDTIACGSSGSADLALEGSDGITEGANVSLPDDLFLFDDFMLNACPDEYFRDSVS